MEVQALEQRVRSEGRGVEISRELVRLARVHGWSVEQVARFEDGVWLVNGKQPESAFEDEVHARVAAREAGSVWFTVRNTLILDLLQAAGLPPSIWEVGSGTGVVAGELTRLGCDVVAVEPSIGGAMTAAPGVGASIASTLEALHLPPASLPAIGLFDVIEHLADPYPLLTECRRVLEPDGRLFLTVPAMPWLWSSSDEVLGHHRRYTKSVLRRDLEDCGFVVQECFYRLWSVVIPVAVIRSIPFRLGIHGGRSTVDREVGISSPLLSSLLIRLERMVQGRSPIGTSVFAVAIAA